MDLSDLLADRLISEKSRERDAQREATMVKITKDTHLSAAFEITCSYNLDALVSDLPEEIQHQIIGTNADDLYTTLDNLYGNTMDLTYDAVLEVCEMNSEEFTLHDAEVTED